jgi:arylsulfatase
LPGSGGGSVPRPGLHDRAFLLVPAQAIVGEFLKTFQEFPPRQKPASFSIDQALEKARNQQAKMAAAGTPATVSAKKAAAEPMAT